MGKVKFYSQTFSADDETIDFLESIKHEIKLTKSEIIRKLFKFFRENPDQLKVILLGD